MQQPQGPAYWGGYYQQGAQHPVTYPQHYSQPPAPQNGMYYPHQQQHYGPPAPSALPPHMYPQAGPGFYYNQYNEYEQSMAAGTADPQGQQHMGMAAPGVPLAPPAPTSQQTPPQSAHQAPIYMAPNGSRRDKKRKEVSEKISKLAMSEKPGAAAADTNHITYIASLHAVSLTRQRRLVASRYNKQRRIDMARYLQRVQLERIQEEYDAAERNITERLLEALEDRRRRLVDEREGEGLSIESMLDGSSRAHATRRGRTALPGTTAEADTASSQASLAPASAPSAALPPAFLTSDFLRAAGIEVDARFYKATGLSKALAAPAVSAEMLKDLSSADSYDESVIATLNSLVDPYNLAAALLPSAASSSMSTLSGMGPTAQILNGLSAGSKRANGKKSNPAWPKPNWSIAPGAYVQGSKAVSVGLTAVRLDEVESDLAELKKKRQRLNNGHAGTNGTPNGYSSRRRGD